MSCHNCDEKEKNYDRNFRADPEPSGITRDEAMTGAAAPVNVSEFSRKAGTVGDQSMNEMFKQMQQTQELTYEEIDQRRRQVYAEMHLINERNLSMMSIAMRRIYVEEMVKIINCDEIAPSGASPQHALKTLKNILDRPDFLFMDEHYPLLRKQVDERYAFLEKGRINI